MLRFFKNLIKATIYGGAIIIASFETDAAAQSYKEVDLFIYADRSRSVFQNNDGVVQAEQLAEMIRAITEATLIPASDEQPSSVPLFSRDGRLRFYEFGSAAGGRDCTGNLNPLIEGITEAETDALTTGLDEYTAQAGQVATNFACLFDDIGGDEALRQSLNEGRQPVVLIASDFVQDRYNASRTNRDRPGGPPPAAWEPGEGTCDQIVVGERRLEYRMPTSVRTALDALTARYGPVADGSGSPRPIFGVLRFDDPIAVLPENPTTYAQCSSAIANVPLLAPIVRQELGAIEYLSSGDPSDFASTVATAVREVILSEPRLSDATFRQSISGAVSIDATVRLGPGQPTITLRRVIGTDANGTAIFNEPAPETRIAANQLTPIALGPLEIGGGVPDELQLSVEYDIEGRQGDPIATPPIPVIFVGDALAQVTVKPPVIPLTTDPGGLVDVTFVVSNNTTQTIEVREVIIKKSRSSVSRLIRPGSEAPVVVSPPFNALYDTLKGPLERSVDATLLIANEGQPATREITTSIEFLFFAGLQGGSASIRFENPGDQNPRLLIEGVENKSSFPVPFDEAEILGTSIELAGELAANSTGGTEIILPNDVAGISEIISFMKDGRDTFNVRVFANDPTTELSNADVVTFVDIEIDPKTDVDWGDLGMICPAAGVNTSYEWFDDGAGNVSVEIRLTENTRLPSHLIPGVVRLRDASGEIVDETVAFRREDAGDSTTFTGSIPFNNKARAQLQQRNYPNRAIFFDVLSSEGGTTFCPRASIPSNAARQDPSIQHNGFVISGLAFRQDGDGFRFTLGHDDFGRLMNIKEVVLTGAKGAPGPITLVPNILGGSDEENVFYSGVNSQINLDFPDGITAGQTVFGTLQIIAEGETEPGPQASVVIPPEMLQLPQIQDNPTWTGPEEPSAGLRFSFTKPNGSGTINRIVFSRANRNVQSSDYTVVDFPEPITFDVDDQQVDHVAPFTRAMQLNAPQVAGAEIIYACLLQLDETPAACNRARAGGVDSWKALPAFPEFPEALLFTPSETVDSALGGADLAYSVRNTGRYAERITEAAVLNESGLQLGQLKVEDDLLVVGPGSVETLNLRIDNPDEAAAIFNTVSTRVVFGDGESRSETRSEPPSASALFDPPQVTFHTIEYDQLREWEMWPKSALQWARGQFGFSDIGENGPTITGSVRIDRENPISSLDRIVLDLDAVNASTGEIVGTFSREVNPIPLADDPNSSVVNFAMTLRPQDNPTDLRFDAAAMVQSANDRLEPTSAKQTSAIKHNAGSFYFRVFVYLMVFLAVVFVWLALRYRHVGIYVHTRNNWLIYSGLAFVAFISLASTIMTGSGWQFLGAILLFFGFQPLQAFARMLLARQLDPSRPGVLHNLSRVDWPLRIRRIQRTSLAVTAVLIAFVLSLAWMNQKTPLSVQDACGYDAADYQIRISMQKPWACQ